MNTITIDRAVVEQALEALRHVVQQAQENLVPTIHYGPVHDTMNNLRAALAQPVPHGCHVDLHPGMKPDGCVLDDGRPENCIYAKRLLREGKDKTACEYWKPIEVTR